MHEQLEAYSQIASKGVQDPATTFHSFVHECMMQPGAYILTVAHHTTGVCVCVCMCVCVCVWMRRC